MSCVRVFRPALLLTGACVLAAVTGCGSPSATTDVSGTIKVKGKAPNLKGMIIEFLAVDGRDARAPINADGTYSAQNVPTGEVAVGLIYTPVDAIKQRPKPMLMPGKDPSAGLPPTPNPIPVALRSASTSKLTFNVEPGKNNVFDYDVQP
jgi:hypothetical protein